MKYDFNSIESKWQTYWANHRTFRTPNPADPDFDPQKAKFYVLDMFPYPSGVGLHVGHPLGYIATDIIARYQRMQGKNVLHPMGYDAFGLPAEQFAVESGVHPRITTQQNIDNMTRQLKRLGLSYDWDRALATTDPDYYRWTQWIFLQIYNSWFDPSVNKARPISELIAALEGEDYFISPDNQLVLAGIDEDLQSLAGTPIGLRKWSELSNQERRQLIDNHRLAYLDEIPVNWCPMLGTVLANEEVTNDGKSERGNFPVYRRPLKQWILRITAYAQRLSDDLDLVNWPPATKMMQRNWIGRSEGAYVDFSLAYGTADSPLDSIRVFTTRPDTLFGSTYLVLAPEHPLVHSITTADQKSAVARYQHETSKKTDVDRIADAASSTKTGVFTGAYALNPVNNEKIPIWIADYVLMGYGTGAIMAVPAHDQRDFDFAKHFHLPIRAVVTPDEAWLRQHLTPANTTDYPETQALLDQYLQNPGGLATTFSSTGLNINSANDEVSLDNLPTPQAKSVITQWLENRGLGQKAVQYKLRDWLFSRQRYWGEPFPILHGPDGEIVALDESQLPVLLPDMADFKPSASDNPDAPPQPPLARAPESWKYVTINGKKYTREFNTMPQWAGSCWYYLRFLDPKNTNTFVSKSAEQYWMLPPTYPPTSSPTHPPTSPHSHAHTSAQASPENKTPATPSAPGGVDLYIGGVEHAVLHLLYARFWHKVLFDLGHLSTPEPFGQLYNQGYIQAHAYRDHRGIYVPADEVEEKNNHFFYQNQPVTQEFGKMGKSLKNAIAPDDICAQYGCDTLRLYEMYLGPLDQSKVWRTRDITGVHRFLQRLWRNFIDEESSSFRITEDTPSPELLKATHKTIHRVTQAMDAMAFNVAIAALIELNNQLVSLPNLPRQIAQPMVLLLAPLAPHIAEELWSRLGHSQSLSHHPWPVADPKLLIDDTIEYPIQINGKLRGKITAPADADMKTVEAAALNDEKIAAALKNLTIKKIIVIPKRMVNIVAS